MTEDVMDYCDCDVPGIYRGLLYAHICLFVVVSFFVTAHLFFRLLPVHSVLNT